MSISNTLSLLTEIADKLTTKLGETPEDYVVKAQPLGAVERVDGGPISDELSEALKEEFNLNEQEIPFL